MDAPRTRFPLLLAAAVGGGTIALLGERGLAALTPTPAPTVVRAPGFEVTDAAGRVVASLAKDSDGSPRLSFLGTNGELRAALTVGPGGPTGLTLYDEAGIGRVGLSVSKDNGAGLVLTDGAGKARVILDGDEAGTTNMMLFDAAGNNRISLSADEAMPGLVVFDTNLKPRSVVTFTADDDAPRVLLFDAEGREVGRLGAPFSEKVGKETTATLDAPR